jgi:hypothetical protein
MAPRLPRRAGAARARRTPLLPQPDPPLPATISPHAAANPPACRRHSFACRRHPPARRQRCPCMPPPLPPCLRHCHPCRCRFSPLQAAGRGTASTIAVGDGPPASPTAETTAPLLGDWGATRRRCPCSRGRSHAATDIGRWVASACTWHMAQCVSSPNCVRAHSQPAPRRASAGLMDG